MQYRPKSLRRRRNTNKWECVLVHTDPLTGEDVSTYHTVLGKTRKQAEQSRCDLIVQLELKGFSASSDMTVRQLMEGFLEYKVSSKTIEPSTIRGYKGETKTICRYIGAELISDLSVPTINAWMANMSDDSYAPKTISKCFRLLKQALNYAVSLDLLSKNPCNFCKPPKRVKAPINALSREERSRMLDLARHAQPGALAVAIEIMLTTGMRRGEVCALRWSDFDESKRTITVSHALGSGEGGFYLKEPKAGRSRIIPLTEHTYNLLKGMQDDLKWMCNKLKLRLENAYILGTLESESRPYNPTQIGKDFSAFCKMNGFDCTLHDLRHTFATFMIAEGADVRTVSDYLGHANPSMTLDIYADVDPEAKQRAVKYIEGAFDDTMSVFQRDIERRKAEIDDSKTQPCPERISGITPESIPFSIEELEEMIAVLKKAS
ncbi:site-specific integrase [Adlercreutzia sp. ZJ138]|uniref:tyrosine-type recombinase/integrase n=1 Tax=Adlercreutzia sp. ZJ138 TaxID=2709405 RepID=UPI0013EA40F9|nr:site-specific integrase [Adlercreutzia sp. ZJ138]